MNDRISQLMDGELDDRDARNLIEALGSEGAARDTWRTYHLIGDAMRDTPLLRPGFGARLEEKLAAEPTVIAPHRIKPRPNPWIAMPAAVAASLAGVALVGWLAFAPQSPAPVSVPVAQVEAPAKIPSGKPESIPLPSAMPDYLLAHQGFSPRFSLQGMAAYARTVSDEAREGRK
jgi:sigma-E factor negative regulatory protein RseA